VDLLQSSDHSLSLSVDLHLDIVVRLVQRLPVLQHRLELMAGKISNRPRSCLSSCPFPLVSFFCSFSIFPLSFSFVLFSVVRFVSSSKESC
jgi:hypothetical protein